MTRKHSHPCMVCGRGIATHRTKGRICSKTCREERSRIVSLARRRARIEKQAGR